MTEYPRRVAPRTISEVVDVLLDKHGFRAAVRRFDANQFRGRRATADSSAALIERATGQVVWRDHHLANKPSGGFFSFALFSPVEELRTIAQRAMNGAMDALLDNPKFRAVLRRG